MSEGPAATVGGGTALLQNVSVGVGVVAGVLASFYSVGMLLVSLRLQQYGLPVEPVVGQLTQQSLAIVGLIEVGLPALGVAILCAILRGAALFAWRRLTRTEMAPLQFIELVGWVTAALLLTGPAAWLVRTVVFQTLSWDPLRAAAAVGVLAAGLAIGLAGFDLSQRRLPHRRPDEARAVLIGTVVAGLVGLSTLPNWVFFGATLPLTDAKLCAKSGASEVVGWLVGTTSDRLLLGVADSGNGGRYVVSVPATDFTLLEGLNPNGGGQQASVRGACPRS